MKKKFNRKKTLFSVICGFVLSFICGFGFMDMKEAKADESIDPIYFPISDYAITQFPWANYFDVDSTRVYTSRWESTVDFSSAFSFYLGDEGESLSSVKLKVIDSSLFSDLSFISFSLDLATFSSSDASIPYMNPLSSLVAGSDYIFNANAYCTNTSANCVVTGLLLSDSSGHIDIFSPKESTLFNGYNPGSFYDVTLSFSIVNPSKLNNGDIIYFDNLSLFLGDKVYQYSDYFYDLIYGFPYPLPQPFVSDCPELPDADKIYQDGYLEGLSQSQYGFLGTNNIFLVITYTDGHVARHKIEPTRIFGGLDFTNVYNDYVPNINDTVSSSRLEFYFSPFVRPSALTLYGEGPAYFFNSNMVVNPEVSGNSNPVLNWHVSSDNSTLYETILVRGENLGDWKAVSLFSANYTSFDFLKGLRLFVTDSNLYENGYLVGSGEGYDKGYSEGLEATQQEIYDKAYDEGHRIGYDDGFVIGSRANNSFLGLFTAVIDAPVLTFTSMLDFDILGYNMKSIVLSLLSIALVVAIIRLFSKGGSAG